MAVRGGAADGRRYGGRSADQRAGDRRRRLLDAGLALYGSQGYAAISIEQLCVAAAVSTRSFYAEVGSREKLLIAVVDDISTRAAQAAERTLAELADQPLPVRVARGLRAYLEVTCHDRHSARICYIEVIGVSAAVENWRHAQRDRMRTVMVAEAQRAVARGEAAPRDFRLFALALVGAVNSLAQELAVGTASAPTLDELCGEIALLATSGLTVQ